MASLKFCATCNTMLEPREKIVSGENKLVLHCRSCFNEEDSEESLVWKHELHETAAEQAVALDTVYDNTLAKRYDKTCMNRECLTNTDPANHRKDVAYFQKNHGKDATMQLQYICRVCRHAFQDAVVAKIDK